jgi:predicted dienelactone hydrolase
MRIYSPAAIDQRCKPRRAVPGLGRGIAPAPATERSTLRADMRGTRFDPGLWRIRALTAALTAVVVLAGCRTAGPTDGAAPETTPTAVTDDVGMPDEPGPYGVVRVTVTLTDPARAGRALPTDIWYPVDPALAETAPPAAPYPLVPSLGLDPTRAVQDVAVSTEGPFPLVVFSHGSGAVRWHSAYFTELLASHGFVVASADHVGNTTFDNLLGTAVSIEQSAVDRPRDAIFVIDALLAGANGAPTDLVAAIDSGRIGIGGHSFGGYTGLATASGRPGLPADGRIRAVLGLAAWTVPLSDAELEAIDVPTMLISATLDTLITVAENTERPWDLIPGRPLYRVDLVGAGHQSFTGVCDYQELGQSLPEVPGDLLSYLDRLARDSCEPQYLPLGTVQRLVDRYGIAFFEAHVAGDPSAKAWLDSDAARASPEVSLQVKP